MMYQEQPMPVMVVPNNPNMSHVNGYPIHPWGYNGVACHQHHHEERPRSQSAFHNKRQFRAITTEKKFELHVDVTYFHPSEIGVKIEGGFVIIVAQHGERTCAHVPDGFVSRQFSRRYLLPQRCDPDAVKARLTPDGFLVVTCPFTYERVVPIVAAGPIKTDHVAEARGEKGAVKENLRQQVANMKLNEDTAAVPAPSDTSTSK